MGDRDDEYAKLARERLDCHKAIIPAADLAAMEARTNAADSDEEYAKGRVALHCSPMRNGSMGIWYDDGDLCAEVHDNMGLGMYGEQWAEFFAAARQDMPRLLAYVRHLERQLAIACHIKADDKVAFDWAVLGRIDELENMVESMAERIAAASEVLAKVAERRAK